MSLPTGTDLHTSSSTASPDSHVPAFSIANDQEGYDSWSRMRERAVDIEEADTVVRLPSFVARPVHSGTLTSPSSHRLADNFKGRSLTASVPSARPPCARKKSLLECFESDHGEPRRGPSSPSTRATPVSPSGNSSHLRAQRPRSLPGLRPDGQLALESYAFKAPGAPKRDSGARFNRHCSKPTAARSRVASLHLSDLMSSA